MISAFIEIVGLDLDQMENPVAAYWVSPIQMVEAGLFGIFFGLLFIAVNEVSEKTKIEQLSFGKVILFKSLLYLLGSLVCFLLVYLILTFLGTLPEDAMEQMLTIKHTNSMVVILLLFLGFQIVLLNFIIQTIKKFGPNNMLDFLTGKYQNPTIEDRIFLFMDLKASTTYAETLGSLKYSQLIQDCFSDINQLVEHFEAEIYQYVGDEVVLTWKTDKVLTSHNCIKVFYSYKKWLENRAGHYSKKYNLIPQFKAGLHGGMVTVAEIGNIKREIAYHGDVLNTTSRIQSVCNQYHEQLLISGELLLRIGTLHGFTARSIGELQLKGKKQKVEVHAIVESLD